MKYGDSLKHISIPQWAYYNVDYQEIKHIIKARTTHEQARPLSIPGQGADVKERQDLEDELFAKLQEEHDNANDFVKSKHGEIQQRLRILQKQVDQLARQAHSATKSLNQGQQQVKFSLLEGRIFKVGEEIQSLQRFVQANCTALKKLLKKYKRWTGSVGLESRFLREVLNRRNSYLANDYSALLGKYTDVLTSCREAYDNWSHLSAPLRRGKEPGNSTMGGSIDTDPRRTTSSFTTSKPLYAISQSGSDVEFDSALATLPLGAGGGRATYWVHQDNIIALRVLLLEYANNRPAKTRPSVSAATSKSSISSLHKQALGERSSASGTAGEEVCLAIFDDIDEFSRKQSAVTVGDIEIATDTVSEKATLSARWSGQTDAMVTLVQQSNHQAAAYKGNRKLAIKTARLKRKNLRTLFDIDQPVPESPLDSAAKWGAEFENIDTGENLPEVRDFIASHSRVEPLVQIQSRRNRFLGLNNQTESGLWATLDTNVMVRRIDLDSLGTSSATTPVESTKKSNLDGAAFPHGILEIRWEGGYSTELVQALDHSHLVERVRGFSIETHAVASLCQPPGLPSPFWMPLLEKDIRKIPQTGNTESNRPSGKSISNDSGGVGGTTSTSVTSYDQPESGFSAAAIVSSATSTRDLQDSEASIPSPKKKKPIAKRHYGSVNNRDHQVALHERYWNEFDDGEEAPESERYVLYVDPDSSSTFPGLETLSKMWKNVQSLIGPKKKHDDAVQPLLSRDNPAQASFDSSESDDVEAALGRRLREHSNRSKWTNAPRSRLGSKQSLERSLEREKALLRSCVGSFAASFVLLLITLFLPFVGRRKEAIQTEIGVLIGVVAALCFGVIGLSCLLLRKDNVGWWHRSAVLLAFSIVCVLSGILLSLIGHRA